MAKEKIESKDIAEIKSGLVSGKIIIGTERVLKELKKGKLSKIFISSNCPDNIVEDMHHYGSFVDSTIVDMDIHNEDLGMICKKPFSISVLGLMK